MAQAIQDLPPTSWPVTPEAVDVMAWAKLYGEPLFDVPTDLYIPPHALEVFLETFEGPLDLLLYLIRKQNFNVLDIPMAQVTVQYLGYVEQIKDHNLELAAEYLLMAATLMEIKSRMLLPVKKSDTGEEVEDPRAELVRRLLEYEQIKFAAQQLGQLPVLGRHVHSPHIEVDLTQRRAWPDVAIDELKQAWLGILARAQLTEHHIITREALSVREFMSDIMRQLQGSGFLEFSQLFERSIEHGGGRAVLVVNFIAVLELAREALIDITQAQPYAPIYVRLR